MEFRTGEIIENDGRLIFISENFPNDIFLNGIDSYFSNGTKDLPVFNHSTLTLLDYASGGHPMLVQQYLSGQMEQKKTASLERGSIIHKYQENPDEFVVYEGEKPGESLDKMLNILANKIIKNDGIFLNTGDMPSVEIYTMAEKIGIDQGALIEYIKEAREEATYNKNLKFETVVSYVAQNLDYLIYLIESNDKIAMSLETKQIVLSCIDSLKKHPYLSKDLTGVAVYNEIEIYTTVKVSYKTNGYTDLKVIPIKGKIDRLKIDFKNKVATVDDYKTSAFCLHYGFMPVRDYSPFQPPLNTSYHRYNYGRQLTFYRNLVESMLKEMGLWENGWKIECNIIGIQTKFPFDVKVFNFPSHLMAKYNAQIYKLLECAAYGITNGWDSGIELYGTIEE